MLPPFAPSRVRDWTDVSPSPSARVSAAAATGAIKGPVQSGPATEPRAETAAPPPPVPATLDRPSAPAS